MVLFIIFFFNLVVEKKKEKRKKSKLFQVHGKIGLASSLTIFGYILGRGISHSYSNQRDKNLSKLTKLAVNNRRFDGRTPESPAALANQVSVFRLSNFSVLLFWSFPKPLCGNPPLCLVVESYHFIVWLARN